MAPKLGQCLHPNAPWVEGKVYCPDCGTGLVRGWLVLRCGHCKRLRAGVYGGLKAVRARKKAHPNAKTEAAIVCQEKHCLHCGHSDFSIEALPNPQAHQLPWALFYTQPA